MSSSTYVVFVRAEYNAAVGELYRTMDLISQNAEQNMLARTATVSASSYNQLYKSSKSAMETFVMLMSRLSEISPNVFVDPSEVRSAPNANAAFVENIDNSTITICSQINSMKKEIMDQMIEATKTIIKVTLAKNTPAPAVLTPTVVAQPQAHPQVQAPPPATVAAAPAPAQPQYITRAPSVPQIMGRDGHMVSFLPDTTPNLMSGYVPQTMPAMQAQAPLTLHSLSNSPNSSAPPSPTTSTSASTSTSTSAIVTPKPTIATPTSTPVLTRTSSQPDEHSTVVPSMMSQTHFVKPRSQSPPLTVNLSDGNAMRSVPDLNSFEQNLTNSIAAKSAEAQAREAKARAQAQAAKRTSPPATPIAVSTTATTPWSDGVATNATTTSSYNFEQFIADCVNGPLGM